MSQYCTFFVDGLFFGVNVSRVQEVIRYQRVTRVPLAPAIVEGLINLRGQIVTAVDLRRRLARPAREAGALPTNVIVRVDDGTVSFLVDEIGNVVEVDASTFQPPPETLPDVARELIPGTHTLPDRLLLILEPEQVVR